MALRIFNNLSLFTAQRLLGNNSDRLSQVFARISSGERINRSADDSAGMSIAASLRSDTRTLQQGARNLNDGLALVNVADGALAEQTKIVIRMRELASQGATGTIGSTERQTINLEFSAIRAELDRIAKTTEYNGRKLLTGELSSGQADAIELQVGLTSDSENRFNINREVNITSVTSSNLGLDDLNVGTNQGAIEATEELRSVITALTNIRARVGATQNRLVTAINTQNAAIENLTAAESNIKDADLAHELADLTKQQILVQSSSAMIGQANLFPQGVIQLLPS